jgi:Holliday junction resolvase
MAHPNKIRGNALEREIVNQSKEEGLSAKRAYASDGRSLGYSEVVDCVVEDWTIQAKRRKKIAQWLYPEYHGDDVDAVVTRMDRKEALIIMPLEKWIKMMKEIKDGKSKSE